MVSHRPIFALQHYIMALWSLLCKQKFHNQIPSSIASNLIYIIGLYCRVCELKKCPHMHGISKTLDQINIKGRDTTIAWILKS